MGGAGPAVSGEHRRLTLIVTVGAAMLSLAYAFLIMVVASPTSFYTLDDPYIHMALAENLARGHFGVNLGEASNPSSSILWPWMLALFEKIGLMLWAPLIVNIACFVATLRVAIGFCLPRLAPGGRVGWALGLLGAGVLAFNVFGVMFTGMEHSLHVLLTAIVVTRAVDGKHDALAFAAMVLCPLVRFEGVIALAFGVGVAMVDRRWVFGASAVAAAVAILGAYALWLTSIGLPALPSSVLTKSSLSSSAVDGGGGLGGLVANFMFNLTGPSGPIFALFAGLMVFAAVRRTGRDRWVALGVLAVLGLSFVAGRFNSYARYEPHALAAAGMASVHLFSGALRSVLAAPLRTVTLCLGLVVVCLRIGPYVATTAPMGARNIDRQQHQMHQLAVQCWKQPVAVNDLGWVSFRNDAYVLDLWGLGSEAAREARAAAQPGWMERLVADKDARLAMIYDDWFVAPADWVKVGTLGSDDPRVTPYSSFVAVFATRADAVGAVRGCLEKISGSMPAGAWVKLAG